MPSGRDWFRLYNRMTQDPKIQHLSDYEFRLIIHIWCLASDSSERGLVYVAPGVGYEPDILARGAGCREGDPVAALGILEKLQLIKVDSSRVIYINNWDKLQYEFECWTPEKRREQKALERARKKASEDNNGHKKSSVASMSQQSRRTDTDTDTDTEINKNICVNGPTKQPDDAPAEKPQSGGAQQNAGKGDEYTEDFLQFWATYPRKVEKRKAWRNWQARLKQGANPLQIIASAKHYSQACVGKEQQFIKHASTFLGPDKPYEEWIRAPAGQSEAKSKGVSKYAGVDDTNYDPEKLPF